MKLKRDFLWIILFGSLIGLNETLVGGMHIEHKSIILSVITLLLLSIARNLFPKTGTSLMIIAVAVLFKITDLGIHGCKVEGMVILGVAFEVFATLIIRKGRLEFYFFSIVSMLAALFAFAVFAMLQRYVIQNEFWNSPKFSEYIFVKGPYTSMISAVISLLGVLVVKPLIVWYDKIMAKNPYGVHGVLGLLIVVFWFIGYVTV
jgi:hypothetical protein